MSWDGPTLLDSFECDGDWWLPGDLAAARVAGRLSFDPAGGVHLKTQRPFLEEKLLDPGEGFRPNVVLGFGDYGTPITLYRAMRVGPVRPSNSDAGSEFYARYAVIGHHFHRGADMAFTSLQAGFTDLEEWAKHHPFVGATIPVPGEPRTGYREMKLVEAEVDALGARLTIKSDISSWGLVPMRTLRWEHRIVFRVEPAEKKPIRWYRDVLGGLQAFLTLMVGRPVYPSAIEAQVHRGGSAHPDLFFDGGLRTPEDRSPASVAGLSRGGDVLLPLKEVRGELPVALENWFAKREQLSPVQGLFFGGIFGPRIGPEFQFLSLAQALESYHRRTRPGNEWTLRQRVENLLEELPEGGVIERERSYFSGPVVDTRNYLTHYPKNLEDRALRGPDLLEAVDELRRVLAFFFLRELGVGETKAVAALTKVPRYEYFALGE